MAKMENIKNGPAVANVQNQIMQQATNGIASQVTGSLN